MAKRITLKDCQKLWEDSSENYVNAERNPSKYTIQPKEIVYDLTDGLYKVRVTYNVKPTDIVLVPNNDLNHFLRNYTSILHTKKDAINMLKHRITRMNNVYFQKILLGEAIYNRQLVPQDKQYLDFIVTDLPMLKQGILDEKFSNFVNFNKKGDKMTYISPNKSIKHSFELGNLKNQYYFAKFKNSQELSKYKQAIPSDLKHYETFLNFLIAHSDNFIYAKKVMLKN